MQKAFTISAVCIALAYLLYLIFTLNLAPLPWFDEVFFASISKSLVENGNFIATVSYTIRDGKESLAYGPVYFVLTGGIFKVFGFGIWQARIINMIAGLCCIGFAVYYFRKKGGPAWLSLLFGLVFLFDPMVNQTLPSGRMDWLAAFLVVLSLFFIQGKGVKYILLSSVFAAAAILTTPRSCVILLPLVPFAIHAVIKDKQALKPVMIWCICACLIYTGWIIYAFGSLSGMISFYKGMMYDETPIGYIGGRFYIAKSQLPLILIFSFSLVWALIFHREKFRQKDILYSLTAVVCFYLIVLDWGLYSVYILPFIYYCMFSFAAGNQGKSRIVLIPLTATLIFNITYVSAKSVQIISDSGRRNPEAAYNFTRKNIPEGSHVLGDGLYYYPATLAGSSYELVDVFHTLEKRERKHRENFEYEFIIVTRQSGLRCPETIKYYLSKGEFIKIDSLITTQSPVSRLISGSGILSGMEDHCYDAVIYKRVK